MKILIFYWTHWHCFNNLQMWTKCTLKPFFKISVHKQNYCKSYTSLKFWLKNILSLWSWGQIYRWCCLFTDLVLVLPVQDVALGIHLQGHRGACLWILQGEKKESQRMASIKVQAFCRTLNTLLYMRRWLYQKA